MTQGQVETGYHATDILESAHGQPVSEKPSKAGLAFSG